MRGGGTIRILLVNLNIKFMGFNSAPGSNIVNDEEKARAMAEAANKGRSYAARMRGEGNEGDAKNADAAADFEERQAKKIYEEKKRLKKFNNAELQAELELAELYSEAFTEGSALQVLASNRMKSIKEILGSQG